MCKIQQRFTVSYWLVEKTISPKHASVSTINTSVIHLRQQSPTLSAQLMDIICTLKVSYLLRSSISYFCFNNCFENESYFAAVPTS